MQPSEVLDLLADQHVRVQAAFLRHVAEAPALRLPDLGAPFHLTVAGVEVDQAEDGAHRGRLAGAVRPEEADHLAGGNREGEMVERDDLAVSTGQPVELQQATRRHCHRHQHVPPRLLGASVSASASVAARSTSVT